MISNERREVARKPFEKVAADLKGRILAGEWRPGVLLPGRRALATEYDVAGATLERAIAVLSGEGWISISDRRGTFVAESLPEPFASPPAAVPRAGQETQSLVATVGIVASVHPDTDPETYAAQWQLQVLQGCEHRLEQALGGRMANLGFVHAHFPFLCIARWTRKSDD